MKTVNDTLTLELPMTPETDGRGGDSCPAPCSEFRCIVADPPWPYNAPGQFGCTLEHRPNRDTTLNKLGAGSRSRYGAMEIEELCALRPPAEDNAHLYLWFTNAFAVEAHAIAKAWGFRPTTILTWTKVKPSGEPSMKMGYYFRGATEHVLFCVRGKMRLQAKRAVPTAMLWPRTPHSEKPDAFYRLVEECSPGPYLELFARRKRHGWASWGNEIANDVEMPNTSVEPRGPRADADESQPSE